jgi:hypothetical protein
VNPQSSDYKSHILTLDCGAICSEQWPVVRINKSFPWFSWSVSECGVMLHVV